MYFLAKLDVFSDFTVFIQISMNLTINLHVLNKYIKVTYN